MQNERLIDLIDLQIKKDENNFCMKIKNETNENIYSWKEVNKITDSISSYLLSNNINHQDKVGILSQNKPEWSFIDIACLKIGACSVPMYPTTTEEHLIHIINDAEIKIIFIGEEEQFIKVNKIKNMCPSLKKIIYINNDEFESIRNNKILEDEINKRKKEIKKEDLVTLIYTSGTTGLPKGVKLDNENFYYAIKSHEERIKINNNDVSLCFLPLSHIFERAWSYFVLVSGGCNYYLNNPQDITEALKYSKPTVMSSVPRFFEKVYSKVQIDLEKASESKRNLFKWATRTGRKVFSRKSNKEFVSPLLLIKYYIAKKLVFSKFKDGFGGNIRFFNCGGASLQDDVNLFFHSLGIPIIYGYGLTESLATVSCYTKIPAIGSVGKPMDSVKIKISDSNNEILLKGKTITKGYYNLPNENKLAFTEDGWFRTGDAGRIDAEGNLYYTERIKELMKTSNGKYIAPQNVEGTLLKDKFIDQVAIIAEGETFVSALIVPDYSVLEDYAKEKAIVFKDKKELIANSEIIKVIETRVKEIQEKLHGFEQVKKFKLLEKPFTIKTNEITPTLKLKRKVIAEKYRHLIDDIYNKKQKTNKDEKD